MNLKLIESFLELIELGAFANKDDIVKGLKSAIKVTKEQAKLTDEEILSCWHEYGQILTIQQIRVHFARAVLKKAQEKN